jgi:hypothetical protein
VGDTSMKENRDRIYEKGIKKNLRWETMKEKKVESKRRK